MTSTPLRISYFDSLRAIATIAVIIIHLWSPLLKTTWMQNMPYWWFANLMDASLRFAVPVFIMLSGATLLGRHINLKDFYLRRFHRVVVPFAFWMLVYWIYRWLIMAPEIRPTSWSTNLSWAIGLFLKEGVSKHFWFVYMIIFLYLGMPFISRIVQKLNQQQLLMLILVWWVLTVFGHKLPFNAYRWDSFYESKFTGYLLHSGYLLLGLYLSQLNLKMNRIALLGVYFASVLIAAYFVYTDSMGSNKLNLSIYSYISSNSIMQSAVVFLLLKGSTIQNKTVLRVQDTISNYSFGIYLVHMIFIGILFQNHIYWSYAHPIISLSLLTFVVLIASIATIYIIRKNPWGKYISG